VGLFEFVVTEESISHATSLATVGEQWFKKEKIEKKLWCQFMVNPKQKMDCKKGFQRSALLGKWKDRFMYYRSFSPASIIIHSPSCITYDFFCILSLVSSLIFPIICSGAWRKCRKVFR